MTQLPNITSKRLEIGTLFIQPTRWCYRNCPGCYVKAHQYASMSTLSEEQYRWLFHNLIYGTTITANQVTISIDDLPRDLPSILSQTRHAHMISILRDALDVWNTTCNMEQGSYPELHITCRNVGVLDRYATEGGILWKNFQAIDVVSFSEIIKHPMFGYDIYDPEFRGNYSPSLKYIKHINYNHMAPTNITSDNLEEHLDKMREILKVVDSMYLIVFKPPIGQQRTERQLTQDIARLRSDVIYINTLMRYLEPELRRKINIDGCIDCLNKGEGCPSNVSRFQLWPDGSVSGCPYAHKSNTNPATLVDEVILNIKKARETYDFDQCNLRQIIHTHSR